MPKLGVNIDHVATLRQARGESEPDPILAAKICEKAGADSIVCHLREDRRHINDNDVKQLRKIVKTRLNLEMSLNEKIVKIACRIKPDQATLVPERRQEITTEGGLDVIKHFKKILLVTKTLQKHNVEVSLFIEPTKRQVEFSYKAGVEAVELHTGRYANATTSTQKKKELERIRLMTQYALKLGLTVNAGHGLKYHDTKAIARISGMNELNIGHSIISRAVFDSLNSAVQEMLHLVKLK